MMNWDIFFIVGNIDELIVLNLLILDLDKDMIICFFIKDCYIVIDINLFVDFNYGFCF